MRRGVSGFGGAAPRLVEQFGELAAIDLRQADEDRRVAAVVVGEEEGLGLRLHQEALLVVVDLLQHEHIGLAQARHELLADAQPRRPVRRVLLDARICERHLHELLVGQALGWSSSRSAAVATAVATPQYR